jgi:hypothetical protein
MRVEFDVKRKINPAIARGCRPGYFLDKPTD